MSPLIFLDPAIFRQESDMQITRNRRAGAPSDDPAERILATARRLFYAAGYPTTGINQIIEESGTSKKSFYRYFPAKDDLGAAYLEREKEEYLELFRGLSARSPAHTDFVRAWCFILKKEVGARRYHGCPFANFASQTQAGGRGSFRRGLRGVIDEWRDVLTHQLRHGSPPWPAAAAERGAETILMLYEGAIALWRMTGELRYLERLEEELLALVSVRP